MFYVSTENGDSLGIMDSRDNVEEFYSRSDVERFRGQGIVIHSQKDINEFAVFLWNFFLNSQEYSSSEFEEVLDFMDDKGVNRFGCSRGDYANSLKGVYREIKALGFKISLRSLLNPKDMLVSDLHNLYFKNRERGTYNSNVSEERCRQVARKWKLSEKEVVYYFGL